MVLAVVLAPEPPLLLLDEPTRGLDYAAKEHLSDHLRLLGARGHCVVIATHDVELVAEVADRVVVLADGEVTTDGPARSVVCRSAGLSSQVARILAPGAVADGRGGGTRLFALRQESPDENNTKRGPRQCGLVREVFTDRDRLANRSIIFPVAAFHPCPCVC